MKSTAIELLRDAVLVDEKYDTIKISGDMEFNTRVRLYDELEYIAQVMRSPPNLTLWLVGVRLSSILLYCRLFAAVGVRRFVLEDCRVPSMVGWHQVLDIIEHKGGSHRRHGRSSIRVRVLYRNKSPHTQP